LVIGDGLFTVRWEANSYRTANVNLIRKYGLSHDNGRSSAAHSVGNSTNNNSRTICTQRPPNTWTLARSLHHQSPSQLAIPAHYQTPHFLLCQQSAGRNKHGNRPTETKTGIIFETG